MRPGAGNPAPLLQLRRARLRELVRGARQEGAAVAARGHRRHHRRLAVARLRAAPAHVSPAEQNTLLGRADGCSASLFKYWVGDMRGRQRTARGDAISRPRPLTVSKCVQRPLSRYSRQQIFGRQAGARVGLGLRPRLLQEGQAEPRRDGDLAAARVVLAAAAGRAVGAAAARRARAQVRQLPMRRQAAAVHRAVPARGARPPCGRLSSRVPVTPPHQG